MAKTHDTHVLPRPVTDPLPDYANVRARANAADKLQNLFGLSPDAARALADAAVDPAELRRAADNPEPIRVPGGTVYGIRANAWARKILPDPRNPRVGPSRRHPFAVDPGTDEDSRFRPVPDPTSNGLIPELHVRIESRAHLTWALAQSKRFILRDNDWRDSIRSQGVMEEVWLTATCYHHEDESADLWAATTAEGSSRITGVHDILGAIETDPVTSANLAYDTGDRQMRAVIRRLNEARTRGASAKELACLRCESVPAVFLVQFEPHGQAAAEFSQAVRSRVALRHVDPPKPWGAGPEMEALADACLDELERKGVIDHDRRLWLAGSMTRAEAVAVHLSADPAVRASAIVELFTRDDPATYEAIRLAVTSQSTRRRLTSKLLNDLATALIVRAVGGDNLNVDRVRRYMREAFPKSLHDNSWTATARRTAELVDAALSEIAADPDNGGPGSLELAARAAYPLITKLRLYADQGSVGNTQPDRRTPGEVIEAMRKNVAGVRQLGQALTDSSPGQQIRMVDQNGLVVLEEDGSAERTINDTYLRTAFPPAGRPSPSPSADTPRDHLDNALAELGAAVSGLVAAVKTVRGVVGDDGSVLVDHEGVDSAHCAAWRRELGAVSDDLLVWAAQYRRRRPDLEEAPHMPDDEFADGDDVAA